MTQPLFPTFVKDWLTPVWRPRLTWPRSLAPAAARTAANPQTRQWMALVTALGLFVLAGPAICGLWLGAPSEPETRAEPRSTPTLATAVETEPAREVHAHDATGEAGTDVLAQAEASVAVMVNQLAKRLVARPGDADGWQTLGRAYATLGKHAQAMAAFRTAARLSPDDATLLAEYAFSAAVLDPQGVTGEPAQLVDRALRLDPKNSKALALAGTLAVDRKDYQGAARYWEQLAKVEPAGSKLTRQVNASIAQARHLAATQAGFMNVATPALTLDVLPTVRRQVGATLALAP